MSERLRLILEQMESRPDDRVLTIDCDHGVRGGTRVRPFHRGRPVINMIEAATRILERAAAGKAESIPAALENLDFRDRRVDEISAVRVRLLHRDRAHAHRLVEPCLAPRGKLPISFDLPSQGKAPR